MTIKSPGLSEFAPITLRRGISVNNDFAEWAYTPPGRLFARAVAIDLFNEADRRVITYLVHDCWVSEFQAQPDLDAQCNAIAIETLELENGGWRIEWPMTDPTLTQ